MLYNIYNIFIYGCAQREAQKVRYAIEPCHVHLAIEAPYTLYIGEPAYGCHMVHNSVSYKQS